MNEHTDYLPLGSIVYVKGGTRKYMIIARALQVNVNQVNRFFDYGGCLYPEGLMGDQVMYFQHTDIREIVSVGYSDHENELMVETIQERVAELGLTHADVRALKEDME